MRFIICGAGGLGSVIGGMLARCGEDVTLVGRARHMDAIKANGLHISGIYGDFVVRENLTCITHPRDATGEFDCMILLTKAKDSETALAEAESIKDRVRLVCSLQNGIGKEERLREWAGHDKVIGASTIEGGVLLEPGHAMAGLTTPTTAYFGELDGGITPRIEAVTAAFQKAGFGSRAMEDIRQVLWEKLMQIGTASGWSVSTLGLPLTFPDGLEAREGAMNYIALARDFLKVYKAMGYQPQNFYAPMGQFREYDSLPLDKAVDMMMQLGVRFRERMQASGETEGRTSMHQDLHRRRKMEVDVILKPYLDKAAELKVDVPVLQYVYGVAKVQDTFLAD
ncbi:ketopantoate reductase family protein [Immundisolibacter sp.]|uniref:ketopantoate reductase family protein n=1 Tax=Immundisolibacter sp. TaxID=1934948 RepID=UPI0035634EBC